jgi:hypothetical protein
MCLADLVPLLYKLVAPTGNLPESDMVGRELSGVFGQVKAKYIWQDLSLEPLSMCWGGQSRFTHVT